MNIEEVEDTILRESVIERGGQLYREKLKALFVPGHIGKFLAIDPVTGRYFLGDTSAEAAWAAHDAMPETHFYLKRIGYAAAHSFGCSLPRED
jgi:hypothetical protein